MREKGTGPASSYFSGMHIIIGIAFMSCSSGEKVCELDGSRRALHFNEKHGAPGSFLRAGGFLSGSRLTTDGIGLLQRVRTWLMFQIDAELA